MTPEDVREIVREEITFHALRQRGHYVGARGKLVPNPGEHHRDRLKRLFGVMNLRIRQKDVARQAAVQGADEDDQMLERDESVSQQNGELLDSELVLIAHAGEPTTSPDSPHWPPMSSEGLPLTSPEFVSLANRYPRARALLPLSSARQPHGP